MKQEEGDNNRLLQQFHFYQIGSLEYQEVLLTSLKPYQKCQKEATLKFLNETLYKYSGHPSIMIVNQKTTNAMSFFEKLIEQYSQ